MAHEHRGRDYGPLQPVSNHTIRLARIRALPGRPAPRGANGGPSRRPHPRHRLTHGQRTPPVRRRRSHGPRRRAATVNQYLTVGLIDELRLHIAPFTLGSGTRLFEGVPPLGLEQVTSCPASQVTRVTYRVLP
ncbi:dihydrofolate reductase family protein [Streptomyces europaeiscabiei]|uniref:dihydrofolate reductase family protein n=1 Tax=Streptomyces europaeiscabiei TaxID=146819 RepID=UPI0039904AD0